jgi:hypothetical protein
MFVLWFTEMNALKKQKKHHIRNQQNILCLRT